MTSLVSTPRCTICDIIQVEFFVVFEEVVADMQLAAANFTAG